MNHRGFKHCFFVRRIFGILCTTLHRRFIYQGFLDPQRRRIPGSLKSPITSWRRWRSEQKTESTYTLKRIFAQKIAGCHATRIFSHPKILQVCMVPWSASNGHFPRLLKPRVSRPKTPKPVFCGWLLYVPKLRLPSREPNKTTTLQNFKKWHRKTRGSCHVSFFWG